MAGLLDQFFGSPDQTQALGLLGTYLMAGQAPQGFQAAMQHMAGAKERERKGLLADMEMQEMQAKVADRERQRAFLQSLPSPQMAASQSALMGGGGPTADNAARMPAVSPFAQMMHQGAQAGVVPFGDYLKSFQPQERINKLDVKDFTPESVARFNRSGNYADLIRMDKLHFSDAGGSIQGLNPFTGERIGGALPKTQDPNNIATVGATMRGQDLTNFATLRGQNMTDARSREQNAITREANASQIINDPVAGPMIINKGTGQARQATLNGQPVAGEKTVAAQKGAGDVLSLLDQAEKAIPNATNSYLGAGVDQLARGVGYGTDGAQAGAQLKALEGAIMSKMPRMEGPQSNLDVQLYRQSAGMIGDPTVPNSTKLAAIQTIREIQQRNAGPAKPTDPPKAPASTFSDPAKESRYQQWKRSQGQ